MRSYFSQSYLANLTPKLLAIIIIVAKVNSNGTGTKCLSHLGATTLPMWNNVKIIELPLNCWA